MITVLDMDRVVATTEIMKYCPLYGRAWFKLSLKNGNESLIKISIFGVHLLSLSLSII